MSIIVGMLCGSAVASAAIFLSNGGPDDINIRARTIAFFIFAVSIGGIIGDFYS